jgi:ketosteroid isomerase-like protein
MNLPTAMADFFRMKNAHDDRGLCGLFTEDAVVVDGGEGAKMQGPDEIKKWIEKAISGLKLYTEVRGSVERDGEWVIDTVMSGDFKASPAHFRYFVTLRGDRILALRVEFVGSLG